MKSNPSIRVLGSLNDPLPWWLVAHVYRLRTGEDIATATVKQCGLNALRKVAERMTETTTPAALPRISGTADL